MNRYAIGYTWIWATDKDGYDERVVVAAEYVRKLRKPYPDPDTGDMIDIVVRCFKPQPDGDLLWCEEWVSSKDFFIVE